MWWFFPSGSATTPDKYVIWNYLDNTWVIGNLDRSCWYDSGILDYPVACDSSGNVYEHESNSLIQSPGNSTKPFVQSGPIEIAQGDRIAQVNKIIPDSESNTKPGVVISFKGKQTPLGTESDFGSFAFNTSGYEDARFSARQVSMKVEGDRDQNFRIGDIRIDVKARGKR